MVSTIPSPKQAEAMPPVGSADTTDDQEGQSAGRPDDPKTEKESTGKLEACAVIGLGVVLPLVVLFCCTLGLVDCIVRLALRHPLETITECALAALIPGGNLIVWKALKRKDGRHPIRLGIINGITIGAGLIFASLMGAAYYVSSVNPDAYVSNDLGAELIAIVAFAATAVALYLGHKLRTSKSTRSARLRTVVYGLCGTTLALLGFAASEARPTAIRIAEELAVSDVKEERAYGLHCLRTMNPELDLRMCCTDARIVGLPGLFWRMDPSTESRLYFAVTGKPYRDANKASVYEQSDEYLRSHVVGERIQGLSMLRSALSGTLSPGTLGSTLNWTFVLRNQGFNDQEGRAELALPPGAVVSGLTLWMDGRPNQAAFGATEAVQGAYRWVTVSHRDPALITDLGRGRVLLRCAPVPAHRELKVNVTITAPLKLEKLEEATLTMPRVVGSNFAISGEHKLRLHSSEAIRMHINGQNVREIDTGLGNYLLEGTLKDEDLSSSTLALTVARQASIAPVAARDPFSARNKYIVETLRPVQATPPRHLVVVVDGSEQMKAHAEEIAEALKKLPSSIATAVIVASDTADDEPRPLSEGLASLDKANFSGGRDNLQAVLRAAEEAGSTRGGAVLWIHGAQPSFNQEIYIMEPFASTPSFYELALDDGWTNPAEFFKNHGEIGPFTPIARVEKTIGDDLDHFFGKWNSTAPDYIVDRTIQSTQPDCPLVVGAEAREVATLWANGRCRQLLAAGQTAAAANLAVHHNIVTRVSGATVLERHTDYTAFGLNDPNTASTDTTNGGESLAQRPRHLLKRHSPGQDERLSFAHSSAYSSQGSAVHASAHLLARHQRIAETHMEPLTVVPGEAGQEQGNAQQIADAAPVLSGTTSATDPAAPILQGATNGTIGPQGSDATIIQGLNTGGTVRVNNLADLEALLNIVANGTELLAILYGLPQVVLGFMSHSMVAPIRLSARGRIGLGLACIAIGLSTPGSINWLVASARDANLFS